MKNILESLKEQPKFINLDFSKAENRERYTRILERVATESKIKHAIPLEFGYIKALGGLTTATVASFLLFKAKERIPSSKRLKYPDGWIPVNATDIGKRIAVSRQTVSRELKKLEKEQWISICQIKNSKVVVNSKEYNKPTMVFLHLDKFLRYKYKTTGSDIIPISNEKMANDIHMVEEDVEEDHLSCSINLKNILTLLEGSVQSKDKIIVHFEQATPVESKKDGAQGGCVQDGRAQFELDDSDESDKSSLVIPSANLDTTFCSSVNSTMNKQFIPMSVRNVRKSVRLKLKEVFQNPKSLQPTISSADESLDNKNNLESDNDMLNQMNTLEKIVDMRGLVQKQTHCNSESTSEPTIPFVGLQNNNINVGQRLDNWMALSASERIDAKLDAITDAMLFMMHKFTDEKSKIFGQIQNNSISLPKKERVELMPRKRPSCESPKQHCEIKDLRPSNLADQIINAWESKTQGIKFFKTVRRDKRAKPYNQVCEAVKILEEKGLTLGQVASVFDKIAKMSESPIGTIFMSAWFKSGKGKLSIEHLFIDKNKQESNMPLQMMGLKGYPIEVAIRNESEFFGCLKMKKKGESADAEIPANNKEESHMIKLGILPNPELEGKRALLHKNIKTVIYDWDHQERSESDERKAITNFYRTFYQFVEENLTNIVGNKIIVNNVGAFDVAEIRKDTDEACVAFMLLFVNNGLIKKNHIESGFDDRVMYGELFRPSALKEKIKHLINIHSKIIR